MAKWTLAQPFSVPANPRRLPQAGSVRKAGGQYAIPPWNPSVRLHPICFFRTTKEPAACGLFLLAPRVRLELTTLRLTAECSAIELPRNIYGCDGTRTVVRIPSSPKGIRRLPIFTGRCQPAIVGVRELNFCVRDGNRWILSAIATGKL